MHKATKIRIYPNKKQKDKLAQQFGCFRFVYNEALSFKNDLYEAGIKISCFDLINRLPFLKKEYAWLKEADSQVLQQAIRNLDTAFKNFFDKRAKRPAFKKKYNSVQSIQYPQRVSIEGNKIYLPKIGWIKAVVHRPIIGKIKTVTVSNVSTGKYYASILCEDETAPAETQTHFPEVVGIDLGLKDFAITSDGDKVSNPYFTKRAAKNLKIKQRKLSKKQKTSRKRSKAKLLVAKAHEKIKNARNDFQHKLSRRIADKNQAVGVETLKVKNMLKNRKLSKAISDAAWSSFILKLEYKLVGKGGRLIKLNTFFPSSKLCSSCSCKMDKMPLCIREWQCPICGAFHDRDINAACNIRNQTILELKAAGYTVSARRGLHKTTSVAAACEVGSPLL